MISIDKPKGPLESIDSHGIGSILSSACKRKFDQCPNNVVLAHGSSIVISGKHLKIMVHRVEWAKTENV